MNNAEDLDWKRLSSTYCPAIVCCLFFMLLSCSISRQVAAKTMEEKFDILIVRDQKDGDLLKGKLYVNEEYLGITYENDKLKIQEGVYPGFMRYVSGAGHAQGPLGNMANQGDFLLEVGDVTWSDGTKRSHLLFHGGNKPHFSKGCIMLGAVHKDASGNRYLPEGHVLRKLRRAFYGTDDPNSSPNKSITITIQSNI